MIGLTNRTSTRSLAISSQNTAKFIGVLIHKLSDLRPNQAEIFCRS